MGLQINQYPIERTALGADDFLDIDYWDGTQYRSAKIKGSNIGGSAPYLAFEFQNDLGFTIPKGTIVYLRTSSTSANYPHVELANSSTELTSSKTIGAIYDDVANGAIGLIVQVGEVDNLDTSAYNVGDRLWLSNVDGQVTTTIPQTPEHAVFIGIVTRSQNGNGRIVYNIQNGYEVEELHDVAPTSAFAQSQFETLVKVDNGLFHMQNPFDFMSTWYNAIMNLGRGTAINHDGQLVSWDEAGYFQPNWIMFKQFNINGYIYGSGLVFQYYAQPYLKTRNIQTYVEILGEYAQCPYIDSIEQIPTPQFEVRLPESKYVGAIYTNPFVILYDIPQAEIIGQLTINTNYANVNIPSATKLHSLNIYFSYYTINMPNVTEINTIYCQNMVSNQSWFSQLECVGNLAVQYNSGSFTQIHFPNLKSVGNLQCYQNANVTSVDISALEFVWGTYHDFRNSKLDQASVDHILVKMASFDGTQPNGWMLNNGTLMLQGGTNATPSATGLNAKAILQARGWSVSHN